MANLMTDCNQHVTLVRPRWIILVALGGINALAQTAPPATSASAPSTTPPIAVGAAPSEAAQRQALGPYRMILRSAALPTTKAKPANANAPHAASATGQNAPKAASEPTPALSPAAPPPAVAAIPVATPVVQPVEVPTPPAEETPPSPAAMPNSTTAPAPVVAAPARTALVLVQNDPPALSGPLAREAPTGTVRVSFNVNPDGSTSDLKITASSNRRLNSAVLAAVSKWRYQPIDAAQTTEVEMVFSGE